jgi:hypothetical protein
MYYEIHGSGEPVRAPTIGMNGPALSRPSNSRKHWDIDGDRTLK